MQWTFDQEQIVEEGLRLHKSNQWIAERTGHSVPSVKRKKHLLIRGLDDDEKELPRSEFLRMNDMAVAALLRAHPEKETRFK